LMMFGYGLRVLFIFDISTRNISGPYLMKSIS
jgi:hypothetical protein